MRLWQALILAVVLVGGVSVGWSAAFFPVSRAVIDAERGRQLFLQRCAMCHQLHAESQSGYGPSLHNIGATVAQRTDLTPAEYLFESIVDPGAKKSPNVVAEMPRSAAAGLGRNDLLDLVAFLWQQGGEVSYAQLLDLPHRLAGPVESTGEKAQLATLERGRELFIQQLKCIQCHPLDTATGADLLAPSLWNAGLHSREYLREAVQHPSAKITATYDYVQVIANGVPLVGRRVPSAAGQYTIIKQNETEGVDILTFTADDLESFEDGEFTKPLSTSAMPTLAGQLPPADIEAIVAFLLTLR